MHHTDIVETGYMKAIELLRQNSLAEGFCASSATPHYAAIWSRDSLISTFGANLTGFEDLLATSKRTLQTLSRVQSPLGQIPNAYWPGEGYWDWGESGCTDASALFVIAASHYYKVTKDKAFVGKLWPSLQRTFTWLRYQDANNFGLIDSPEAGDWMDSTLNRCGKVLYVNALYYWAAQGMKQLSSVFGVPEHVDVDDIKFKLNCLFWPSSDSDYSELLRHVEYPNKTHVKFPHVTSTNAFKDASRSRCYYLSHVSYGNFVDKCDVLGNLLTILYEIASPERTNLILRYLGDKKVSAPYPVKCWTELENPSSRWGLLKTSVENYQAEQWRNPPYHYHNAGVWPFIGGIYVLALWKSGPRALAEAELKRLAYANRLGVRKDWGFHEWIDSMTGEAQGAENQSWNAGTYIMAYKAVKHNLIGI